MSIDSTSTSASPSRPPVLTHEPLDVYRTALEFLVFSDELASLLPRGRSHLVDQLRRAALSIVLDIAEGAGEFAAVEKARFYRMARRSANECAAILDVCRLLRLSEEKRMEAGRQRLVRLVEMLTVMVLKFGGEERERQAERERQGRRERRDEREVREE